MTDSEIPGVQIGEYKLIRTCFACPEQYDVYDKFGVKVAYLRLRYGFFEASESADGVVFYDAETEGDGQFEDEERQCYLEKAMAALDERRSAAGGQPMGEVQYAGKTAEDSAKMYWEDQRSGKLLRQIARETSTTTR